MSNECIREEDGSMNKIEILAQGRPGSNRHDLSGRRDQLAVLMPLIFCLAFFWPFGGGGKNIKMMAGKQTPAAHGTVNVQTGRNGNTKLKIDVKDLAEPGALTPPRNVYVVWVQPPDKTPRNEGALVVNKNLDGQLQTRTPFANFRVFITAETDAQVQKPQGPHVLSAYVSNS
jgi:hypothetical protein